MKGHHPTGGWTEVRRKKNAKSHCEGAITNFYVTGYPDGIRKEEIRKLFSEYGKIVDVYLGGKKDYNRNNFAFVRFVDVVNVRAMEERLQGIKCQNKVLSVNIAKHQRKPFPLNTYVVHKQPITMRKVNSDFASAQPQPPSNIDSRSYKQALTGTVERPHITKPPPIVLASQTIMKE
ncbi:unnamed protein product [Lactuca virosa]|uniref:RRM domain-containing protein n=1 Tax=Lactuca virosa TaxID=75947 RepID=A0AAU9PJ65_9ASTR|nr:unnamed protein product [Lactuca virosa]